MGRNNYRKKGTCIIITKLNLAKIFLYKGFVIMVSDANIYTRIYCINLSIEISLSEFISKKK